MSSKGNSADHAHSLQLQRRRAEIERISQEVEALKAKIRLAPRRNEGELEIDHRDAPRLPAPTGARSTGLSQNFRLTSEDIQRNVQERISKVLEGIRTEACKLHSEAGSPVGSGSHGTGPLGNGSVLGGATSSVPAEPTAPGKAGGPEEPFPVNSLRAGGRDAAANGSLTRETVQLHRKLDSEMASRVSTQESGHRLMTEYVRGLAEIDFLRQKLADEHRKQQSLRAEKESAISRAEAQQSALKSEIAELRQQMRAANASLKEEGARQARKVQQQLELERDRERGLREIAEGNLQQLNSQVRRMQEVLQRNEEELSSARAARDEAQRETASLKSQLNKAEKALEEERRRLQEAQGSAVSEGTRRANAQLQQAVRELQQRVEELEQQRDAVALEARKQAEALERQREAAGREAEEREERHAEELARQAKAAAEASRRQEQEAARLREALQAEASAALQAAEDRLAREQASAKAALERLRWELEAKASDAKERAEVTESALRASLDFKDRCLRGKDAELQALRTAVEDQYRLIETLRQTAEVCSHSSEDAALSKVSGQVLDLQKRLADAEAKASAWQAKAEAKEQAAPDEEERQRLAGELHELRVRTDREKEALREQHRREVERLRQQPPRAPEAGAEAQTLLDRKTEEAEDLQRRLAEAAGELAALKRQPPHAGLPNGDTSRVFARDGASGEGRAPSGGGVAEAELRRELERSRAAASAVQQRLSSELACSQARVQQLEDDMQGAADQSIREVGSLADELHRRDGELSGLRRQLEALQEKSRGAEAQLRSAETKLLDKEEQLKFAHRREQELAERLEAVTSELETATDSAERAKSELQVLKSTNDSFFENLTANADLLRTELSCKVRELEVVRKELADAHRDLECQQDLAYCQSSELERLREENTELEAKTSSYESKLERVESDLKDVKEKCEALEKEWADAQLLLYNLNFGKFDHVLSSEDISRLTDDEISNLRAWHLENRGEEVDFSDEVVQIAELKVRIRLWNEEYEFITEEVVNPLKGEKNALEEQSKIKQETIDSLGAQVQRLESRVKEEASRAEELQRRFDYSRENTLEHENSELKKKIFSLTKQVETNNIDLEMRQEERQHEANEIARLESEIDRFRGMDLIAEQLREQIEQLHAEAEQYRHRIEELEAALASAAEPPRPEASPSGGPCARGEHPPAAASDGPPGREPHRAAPSAAPDLPDDISFSSPWGSPGGRELPQPEPSGSPRQGPEHRPGPAIAPVRTPSAAMQSELLDEGQSPSSWLWSSKNLLATSLNATPRSVSRRQSTASSTLMGIDSEDGILF